MLRSTRPRFLYLVVLPLSLSAAALGRDPSVTLPAAGYGQVPRDLVAMSYPSPRAPKLVMALRGAPGFMSADAFPVPPAASLPPEEILADMKRRISSTTPAVSWVWGGAYRLAGRWWAAWRLTSPSMTGTVSSVIAATQVGQSIFAVSLSAPSSEFERLAPKFGETLSEIKIEP